MQSLTFPLTIRIDPAADPQFTLAGGWRIVQPYCKGGLAIDFATMRAWTAGHAQDNPSTLRGYDLPAMGAGTNPANWPQVGQARNYGAVPTPAGWSTANGQSHYSLGLMWRDGLLWTSGKGFYVSGSSHPATVVRKFSLSGSTKTLQSTITVPGRPAQTFGGGFVKGHPAEVLLGCGGYESGQDSRSGPCWMTLAGAALNEFGRFDEAKANREKRPNDYSCAASTWFVPPDGALGYWCAGRVWGGGLYLRGKAHFWADLGTGNLDYARQTDTFGATSRTYLYRYADGQRFGSYAAFATPGSEPVAGQEVNPSGTRVYLLIRNAWSSNGGYDPSPLLCAYDVS